MISISQNQLEEAIAEGRRRFVYYKPHEKQKLFHRLGATATERVFLAGNRTGKTFCGSLEVCMHLTGIYPQGWEGARYSCPITAWAIGVTNDQVRSTLQPYYIGDRLSGKLGGIHPSLIIKTTSKPGLADAVDTVRIRHASGEQSLLCFKSYQQGREVLQSAKVDVIHADEEPPMPIYNELLMRLMSVGEGEAGRILVTATPLLGMTEVVRGFLSHEDIQIPEGTLSNGKAYVQAGWNDNPHLKDDEKERLRQALPAHEIEAREKGIPSLGLGMVYPVSESRVTCDPFEIPAHWAKVYGLDFGWNPSPTAALFCAHDRDNDVLYAYGEYAVTELTPQHHANNLIKMGARLIPGVYDPAGMISSQKDGENLVHLYREAGLIKLSKADNSKEKGLMQVLQRFQNGQLKIFSSLSKTLSEFRMYARNDQGIAKKGNDHLMDCLRYVIMSGLNIAEAPNKKKEQYYLPHSSNTWMAN